MSAKNGIPGVLITLVGLLLAACSPVPVTGSDSDFGYGEGDSQTPPSEAQVAPSDTWVTYGDTTYKFGVDHPSDYTFRPLQGEKLDRLTPKPAAAFVILSPAKANSDVADLEPPDLEIRIHALGQADSLEEWLKSAGMPGADASPKQFQASKVSGLKVCISTMVVPDCSYFFSGGDWVYQLIPASLEGEAMLQTFTLTQ
ncbi:MAG: hypothetical protein HYZ23_01435 [Chloroflexi bacterium]|nr:hypothetical protein [Chloroflexota bacterium]